MRYSRAFDFPGSMWGRAPRLPRLAGLAGLARAGRPCYIRSRNGSEAQATSGSAMIQMNIRTLARRCPTRPFEGLNGGPAETAERPKSVEKCPGIVHFCISVMLLSVLSNLSSVSQIDSSATRRKYKVYIGNYMLYMTWIANLPRFGPRAYTFPATRFPHDCVNMRYLCSFGWREDRR